MTDQASAPQQPAAGWRFKLGIAIFVLSILVPVAGVPTVAALGLSATMTASVSGALLITAEVLGLVAVAVMGKPGYAYIKTRVLKVLKRYGPPQKVGRLRYNIGLVMFWVPIVFGWVSVYVADYIPGFAQIPRPYALVGDLLVITSLFVLGGDFWDKLSAPFVYDAEVRWTSRA